MIALGYDTDMCRAAGAAFSVRCGVHDNCVVNGTLVIM